MDRNENKKIPQLSYSNILFRTAGALLILTMLSIWLVCGLFAKYVISDYMMDSAQVAKSGIGTMELLEHEAELDNGIYKLKDNAEVTENTYNKVIPGVDIAKDPFVRLKINSDVAYELYIEVAKSEYFPDTVTYELTEDWIEVDATKGVYKYKDTFEAGASHDEKIKILKDDKLIVSEHYVGKNQNGDNQTFTLTFNAWIVQVGTKQETQTR